MTTTMTTTMTPATAATSDIGRAFFEAQDRLRGGPAPELCAPGYVANIHTVDDVVSENGKVGVRFTLTGTYRAPFDGIPATGKPIRVSAVAVLRVEGGAGAAALRGVRPARAPAAARRAAAVSAA